MDSVQTPAPEWSKRVFHCYMWDPINRYFVGDCLTTEDISEVLEHQRLVNQEHTFDARTHLLDIDYYDAEGKWLKREGICLPDAEIDVKKGTIEHYWFMSSKERAQG